MYSGFLIGTDESQARLMRRVGCAFVIALVVVILAVVFLRPILTRDDPNRLVFSVQTPRLGIGVTTGTPVILNGVRVGEVSSIGSAPSGDAQMTLNVDRHSVAGMRKDFTFDFRPQNYFGVSAVNISGPGTGGPLLTGHDVVVAGAAADYTMGMMIENGSEFVSGSLQAPLVDSIKRTLAYSAALQPLIHTGVVVADSVQRTQRALPTPLVEKYNTIATALLPFADGVVDSGQSLYASQMRPAGRDVRLRYAAALKAIADQFFTLVGGLLKSNEGNLSSTVQIVQDVASVLPAIGQNALTPMTLRTLVERLDGAFAQSPGGGRTLRVRVELDSLPVLQTPITSFGARQGGSH